MSRSFSVAVSFNLISMISTASTLLVSATMLCLLVKSLVHNMDISVLLLLNNYIGIYCFSLVLLVDNVIMLKGDYGLIVGEETLMCRIQGYLLYVFLSSLMNAFALQVR